MARCVKVETRDGKLRGLVDGVDPHREKEGAGRLGMVNGRLAPVIVHCL